MFDALRSISHVVQSLVDQIEYTQHDVDDLSDTQPKQDHVTTDGQHDEMLPVSSIEDMYWQGR